MSTYRLSDTRRRLIDDEKTVRDEDLSRRMQLTSSREALLAHQQLGDSPSSSGSPFKGMGLDPRKFDTRQRSPERNMVDQHRRPRPLEFEEPDARSRQRRNSAKHSFQGCHLMLESKSPEPVGRQRGRLSPSKMGVAGANSALNWQAGLDTSMELHNINALRLENQSPRLAPLVPYGHSPMTRGHPQQHGMASSSSMPHLNLQQLHPRDEAARGDHRDASPERAAKAVRYGWLKDLKPVAHSGPATSLAGPVDGRPSHVMADAQYFGGGRRKLDAPQGIGELDPKGKRHLSPPKKRVAAGYDEGTGEFKNAKRTFGAPPPSDEADAAGLSGGVRRVPENAMSSGVGLELLSEEDRHGGREHLSPIKGPPRHGRRAIEGPSDTGLVKGALYDGWGRHVDPASQAARQYRPGDSEKSRPYASDASPPKVRPGHRHQHKARPMPGLSRGWLGGGNHLDSLSDAEHYLKMF